MADVLDEVVQELQLVEVFAAGSGGYDWSEFKAWRAPTGRFYWYQDSGCSCYYYGEHFTSAADFSDGDRGALESAFREWVSRDSSNYYVTAQEVIEGLEVLRRL
jgi:hypothetical protein